jgi:tetratricopeptide (TPR) repeat protein
MRGYGCTVAQIAAEMSRRFGLRPRAAWRYALGWQQWKVAQQYNTVHPGSSLLDNRVSECENWPHGGKRPSLHYLANLATTFGHGCTPAQLVDADDLDKFTPAERLLLTSAPPLPTEAADVGARTRGRRGTQRLVLPAGQPASELVVPTDPAVWTDVRGLQPAGELVTLLMSCLGTLTTADGETLTTAHGRDDAYYRLVQFLMSWAHNMKRRNALRALGWAASAASVGYLLDPDEYQRVAAVLSKPRRIDAPTIEHIEAVLWHCRMQEAALGPRAVLDTVLAQRELARVLRADCPAALRPQLLSVLSGASRHAGWLSFDGNDFTGATYFYEEARALAHDAQDMELVAFVLCEMSYLATWRGQPRIGIDHAVAAGQWASHTGDLRLRANVADMAAQAYAADGQRDQCLAALDAAHTALTEAGDKTPRPIHFYNYDEAIHIATRGRCHLALQDAQRAADYIQQSLPALDPSHVRNAAFTTAFLGRARAQSGEVDEATRLLGDAGEVAGQNNLARLIKVLKQGRTELQPWADTAAVRALDDRLETCGVA